MRVHVAFTPDEAASAPVGIVVDVLRATSTIAQALASGYRRVLCCSEIEQARALRAELGEGRSRRRAERRPHRGVRRRRVAARVRGAASRHRRPLHDQRDANGARGRRGVRRGPPREPAEPGRRHRRGAGDRARRRGAVRGLPGGVALDDAYCADRIVQLLDGERSDAAIAADLVARSFATAHDGLTARTYGPPGLEDDIAWCARESVLHVVPRLAGMVAGAAEIRA